MPEAQPRARETLVCGPSRRAEPNLCLLHGKFTFLVCTASSSQDGGLIHITLDAVNEWTRPFYIEVANYPLTTRETCFGSYSSTLSSHKFKALRIIKSLQLSCKHKAPNTGGSNTEKLSP